jgi:thymidylate synthase (FAD)
MKAEYENHYLTDTDVANFARHSFADLAKNFSTAQNDNLIRFLARGMATGDWKTLLEDLATTCDIEAVEPLANYLRKIPSHWVPFGHPHITLRMQAPVPIARQAFKHKIGFVESEESRRYISTRPEFFVPKFFRAAAENVKQGSAGEHRDSAAWMATYVAAANKSIQRYLAAIGDGICPEQARFFLLQGVEVNWVWTGSLYAFAQAYNARSDAHAQQEIQDLFADVNAIIGPLFPVSWAALTGQAAAGVE